jgi:hypothetical protein
MDKTIAGVRRTGAIAFDPLPCPMTIAWWSEKDSLVHLEILHLVERRRLWGRGLSAIDVNLLGSVALVEGAQFWTRDKRLRTVCIEVGIPVVDES